MLFLLLELNLLYVYVDIETIEGNHSLSFGTLEYSYSFDLDDVLWSATTVKDFCRPGWPSTKVLQVFGLIWRYLSRAECFNTKWRKMLQYGFEYA